MGDSTIYNIEKIIKKRKIKGKSYFLIEWKGFPISQASWEPEEMLVIVPEAPEELKVTEETTEASNPIRAAGKENLPTNNDTSVGCDGKDRDKMSCPCCSKRVKYLLSHLKVHRLPAHQIRSFMRAAAGERRQDRQPSSTRRPCPLRGLDKPLQHRRGFNIDGSIYKAHLNSCTVLPQDNAKGSEKRKTYVEFSNVTSDKFCKFIQTVRGGKVALLHAKQQKLKLRKVLHVTEISSVSEFVSDEGIDKLQTWAVDYLDKNKISSLISYLTVVFKFLDYLLTLEFGKSKHESLCRMRSRLNNWKKSLKCEASESPSRTERMAIRRETLRSFKNSDFYKQSSWTLNKARRGSCLGFYDFAQLRNTLLVLIFIQTGCLSGVLASMTLTEFETAKRIQNEEGSFHVIRVTGYKTKSENLSTEVVLSRRLYEHLTIYKRYVRSQLPSGSSTAGPHQLFFKTFFGKSISSHDIDSCISSVWKAAHIKLKFTSLVFRQDVTTESQSIDLSLKKKNIETSPKSCSLQQESSENATRATNIHTRLSRSACAQNEDFSASSDSSADSSGRTIESLLPSSLGQEALKSKAKPHYTTEQRKSIETFFSDFIH